MNDMKARIDWPRIIEVCLVLIAWAVIMLNMLK